jgi:hypothetical protein
MRSLWRQLVRWWKGPVLIIVRDPNDDGRPLGFARDFAADLGEFYETGQQKHERLQRTEIESVVTPPGFLEAGRRLMERQAAEQQRRGQKS